MTLSMKTKYAIITTFLSLLALTPILAISPPVFAQNSGIVSPSVASNCKDCWAGYGDNAAAGSVNMVSAKITQQGVTCNTASSVAQAVADYVTIDGTTGSSDTLFIGTNAVCTLGSSSPTYQAVDGVSGGSVSNLKIHRGDKLAISISISRGIVHYVFKDATTGLTAHDSAPATGDALQSASCVTTMLSADSLAQFNKAQFAKCDATIGSTTAAIGAFGSSATLVTYTTVNSSGTTTLANPTALSSSLSNFKVVWVAAGP